MFIVDYDDIWIEEINESDKWKYESYRNFETFEDAK